MRERVEGDSETFPVDFFDQLAMQRAACNHVTVHFGVTIPLCPHKQWETENVTK